MATVLTSVAALGLVAYIFCLPSDLFEGTKWSTVVTDRKGELLGARIAGDGQWRFPQQEGVELPEKYAKAVIEFEDRMFPWHPGVNPVSILRAIRDNIHSGHIVSGGSTITMQVIRLSRKRERTIWQKVIEAILATRLEIRLSKDEILALYAAHAPFGGNVVGLDAASWRYFGRPSDELSWAEAATLAILPNSPGRLSPGKNTDELLNKRNRLLFRLYENGEMDYNDYSLACEEPLPQAPHQLPNLASHLVDYYASAGKDKHDGSIIRTNIDIGVQRTLETIVNRNSDALAKEDINDMAAVIIEVESGEVLAYCGNSSPYRKRSGVNVDIARAPRSSGSILKPFLYCAALQDGVILPHTLIADTPVNINGFAPQNYDRTYDGAVHASESISRSLNVPSVHLLKMYSPGKFLRLLQKCGMTSFTKSADHYGLSLILGGGEARLDEVTYAYAAMAKEYLRYGDEKPEFPLYSKPALIQTFDAMSEVNRPDEMDWHLVESVSRIAWKTGTSYGYRDGWAVGVNPDYAVGVWAGNAGGSGASGLIGARTAGPALFEIFSSLPSKNATNYESSPYRKGKWFDTPLATDGTLVQTCRLSGHLAGQDCHDIDTLLVADAGVRTSACPYHHTVAGTNKLTLPPAMEWYYRLKHPDYPYTKIIGSGEGHEGHEGKSSTEISNSGNDMGVNGPENTQGIAMEFIYPENNSTIIIPRQMDGNPGEIVLNLAHRNPSTTIFWHLDNEWIGQTRFIHQLRIRPSDGNHQIITTDSDGNTISIRIHVKSL